MKKALLTITILTLASFSFAQQANTGKLSLWLTETMLQQQTHSSRHVADETPKLTTTFIKLNHGVSNDILYEYDCKIYAQLGDIRIVTIPVSQLEALAVHPDVMRIEASPSGNPTLDQTSQVINALPSYQQTSQHQAFTGKGVVVGIMDVGFDLTHPTFYSGQTLEGYRIKTIWDQLDKGNQTDLFPVGREYNTPEDILSLGCSRDASTQDHGTHTTGVAVGSGYNTTYRGIAFESDLALVANAVTSDTIYIDAKDYDKYTSATDALGFKYLFDYAQQQGKPCVVSFSEGYTPYLDKDDQLYSEFLELLIGPGRILVSSAGNESSNTTYMEKPTGVETAGCFISVSNKAAHYRILSDGEPTVRLLSYQEPTIVSQDLRMQMHNELWKDNMLYDTLFIAQDTCAVAIKRYSSELIDGQTMYLMTITANRPLNQLPRIAYVTEGSECRTEVYGSSSNQLLNQDTDPRWNAAQRGHNVLAPGCLSAPICVGSTSHRLSYVNAKGETITSSYDIKPGEWSPYSSTGPTMGGLMKPDVAAPGQNIISSISGHYYAAHPNSTRAHVAYSEVNNISYPWGSKSGTSMSTPVVAGAIALWLQANPNLTKEDIMAILQRTCKHPEEGLSYPNERYGYGEIDVYRGLLDVLGITGISNISLHQPHSVDVYAQDGLLHLTFNKIPSTVVELCIYTTGGTRIYQKALDISQHEIVLPLPSTMKGVYVIQLKGDKGVNGSQIIRN